MSKPKERTVYIRETNFQSYVADAFTFASICVAFWFNYKFVGNNNWLSALLVVCFVLFAIGRAGDFKRLAQEAEKEKA